MTASRTHLTSMHARLYAAGHKSRAEKLAYVSGIAGREVTTTSDLSRQEVNAVHVALAELGTVEEAVA